MARRSRSSCRCDDYTEMRLSRQAIRDAIERMDLQHSEVRARINRFAKTHPRFDELEQYAGAVESVGAARQILTVADEAGL